MQAHRFILSFSAVALAATVSAAQTPPPAGDMIPPEPGAAAPTPQAPTGPAAQGAQTPPPPPPPPGSTPWSAAPQDAPVVMQAPPGYGYPQPMVYGAPMMMMPPQLIPYDGGPVPAGARVVTRARTGLISGGAAMFGSVWLTSLIFSTAGDGFDREGWGWLAVPVVGPLIAGGTMRGVNSTGWTVLILDTLLQAGGLAMFIHGLTHPAQLLSYDAPRTAARQAPRWTIAPAHAAGPGASFALRF